MKLDKTDLKVLTIFVAVMALFAGWLILTDPRPSYEDPHLKQKPGTVYE